MSNSQKGVLHNDSLNKNPFKLFDDWFKEAQISELNDPDAMALASVDKYGLPSVRIVLLKQWSENGFVFFTNYEGRKGQELLATKKAAACLHWKSLRRQVRIVGGVNKISELESDAYFATRPRGSQVGAWASYQSRPIATRSELTRKVTEYEKKFENNQVTRPPYWIGIKIVPKTFEFWQGDQFRLHERELYYLRKKVWQKKILSP